MKTQVKGKNKSILILDDEHSIREALIAAFDVIEGYSLHSSSSYAKLEKKKIYSSDIILLDMRLGGKDGKEVAHKLKSSQRTKNIPLIMMSGYPGAKEQCLNAGADDFLDKPFSIGDLLNTLKKHLG